MKDVSLSVFRNFSIKTLSIESLFDIFTDFNTSLEWTCPFIHPAFMRSWWKHFKKNRNLMILGIMENDNLSGIVPLMEKSGYARFIGSPDLCDYHDVIAIPGKSQVVLTVLFHHLIKKGIRRLQLGLVRPDSFVFRNINHSAKEAGVNIVCQKSGVFCELKLTDTWERFLELLSGKQRHEVRRKFRRLEEAGNISFICVRDEPSAEKSMKTFLTLFKANRRDKSAFMTDQMACFFLDMAKDAAKAGFLKLFFLHIDNFPVASVLCFDFGNRLYLYNNGYDIRFQKLGTGVLSKFLSIKAAIEDGKQVYDFLKGDEAYKERMGASPLPLYNFEVYL